MGGYFFCFGGGTFFACLFLRSRCSHPAAFLSLSVLSQAVRWLLTHKGIDGAIIFEENSNSIVFKDGKFDSYHEY
jgi:hypothetical protein